MTTYKEYILTSEDNGNKKYHKQIARNPEEAEKILADRGISAVVDHPCSDVVVAIRMKKTGNIYTVTSEEEMVKFLTDIIADDYLLEHETRSHRIEDYFTCKSVSTLRFETVPVIFSWHTIQ